MLNLCVMMRVLQKWEREKVRMHAEVTMQQQQQLLEFEQRPSTVSIVVSSQSQSPDEEDEGMVKAESDDYIAFDEQPTEAKEEGEEEETAEAKGEPTEVNEEPGLKRPRIELGPLQRDDDSDEL